jgi:hypothetical protein
VSCRVLLRPVRDQMPFEPTEQEARIVADDEAEARALVAAGPAVATGTMRTEIRPMRIAVP